MNEATSAMPEIKSTNPLLNYYRQPKIYVKLPSKGKYYPEGALSKSETDEYPVFAMTAKDELMFKTPDALMNGQATVEVIKSCVPAILNPWQMPSIDIDAVLIAIRIATYGETMSIAAICPKCGEENEYDLNLINYLNQLSVFDYKDKIIIDPLVIHVKPYSYREITKAAIKAVEQEKIFNIINDQDMSEEEKLNNFGNSFVKLTDLTIGLVTNVIVKIETPEGEVSDHKLIEEFIENAPKEVFKKIHDHLDTMKEEIELTASNVECAECHEQFSTSITLDQSNFFEVRS